MKFLILVKSNPQLEAQIDAMNDAAMKESLANMGAFNEELKKAGVLKDCDGLRPSREGKRVHFDGGLRTVIDRPQISGAPIKSTLPWCDAWSGWRILAGLGRCR